MVLTTEEKSSHQSDVSLRQVCHAPGAFVLIDYREDRKEAAKGADRTSVQRQDVIQQCAAVRVDQGVKQTQIKTDAEEDGFSGEHVKWLSKRSEETRSCRFELGRRLHLDVLSLAGQNGPKSGLMRASQSR